MLSYSESLKILKETNALLEGHFILSSGLHSDQYVQCAKLLSRPKKAEVICESLVTKIKQNSEKKYISSLCIKIPNLPGKLGEVSSLIGFHENNIVNMEIIDKKIDYLEFIFDIQIRDLKNYRNLITELKIKEYKFKIIRHRKKNAFLQRIFKNFKRN